MLEGKVKEDFQNILDCMTGADGGISFIRLRMFLERCQKTNTDNDRQLLEIMSKFSRLITVVNKV